jgi:hypothetical protein
VEQDHAGVCSCDVDGWDGMGWTIPSRLFSAALPTSPVLSLQPALFCIVIYSGPPNLAQGEGEAFGQPRWDF